MIGVKDIEARVRNLNIPTSLDMDKRVLAVSLAAYEKSIEKRAALPVSDVYSLATKKKIAGLTAAVAIIIIFLWGIIDWPSGRPKNGKWWLGPPAAWGQEIIASLERVQAIVFRQRHVKVYDYGPAEVGIGWSKNYCSKDAYRSDNYDWRDGSSVLNTQWILPDGEASIKYEVSYEYECYFKEKCARLPFYQDMMDHLRRYVGLLDKADRILGIQQFDGHDCVGFEISANRDHPDGRFDRIWFDIGTKLPARIERHGMRGSFHRGQMLTTIQDQFEYYAEVPADMFEPNIPEGFINAHPDEVQVAIDFETKGEMVFADVPEGLTDEILAALRDIETCVYVGTGAPPHREYARYVYLSKNAWRIDCYSPEQLQTTEWFIIQQDMDASLLQFEGKAKPYIVAEWECDYDAKTVRVIGHTVESGWHQHPMSNILFLAGFCDRADRFIASAVIDGVECFGFEISAKKYGDNPDTTINRLWFDVETKLPVRMELEYIMDGRLETRVRNRFEWNPELPDDTFIPEIPEGFTLTGSDGR
jgi:outer membrane lipoprotein-sorting protein